jgi:hypothetical protein
LRYKGGIKMTMYLSPLVDVKEIDLSTTIPAVATSIGVSVLRNTWKGPELKRQLINDIDELIEVFGEPDDTSFKDIMGAAGFLQYGNNLYCTRVLPVSATFSGVYVSAGPGPTGGIPTSAGTLQPYIVSAGAYMLGDFHSEDPDEFNNESTVFDGARPDTDSYYSIIAASRGEWGNYVQVGIVGRNTLSKIRKGESSTSIGISADFYDDLVNQIEATLTDDNQFLIVVRAAQQKNINKRIVPYDIVESWIVSTDPRELDDEGGNIYAPLLINGTSRYIRIAFSGAMQNFDMKDVYTIDYQQLGGGARDQGDLIEDASIIESYDIYGDPEVVDVNILIDSDKSVTVKQAILSLCENRKDSMGILDVPSDLVLNNKGNEATDCRDARLGQNISYDLNFNSSYVALYANWLNVFDKWNNTYRWIPASGHVAGIYANTDNVAESWFAPAGLNRGIINNVRKLAWNPVQGERDILYKNGLNPIVSFAGQGKVVFGQKNMLDKNSAFNRVNVRRLFIILAKAISTALKFFLFEPNDSFTRLQIINMIDPFLRDVQARRGIFEYMIVCDDRNNTPERIDRSELWCDIYIKPTRAAEFIVLNLIATKTGASFTELISATAP